MADVLQRPHIVGHNLRQPESLIAYAEIHRRFLLFHADLLDLLWADPLLRTQSRKHGPSEADAWAERTIQGVAKMAASASYLAAVDESVLAEHMEALRVYIGRVLGEKRLWEARSGELGLWALAERTFWFLV